jgi:predicted transposase YbfD/YdcC
VKSATAGAEPGACSVLVASLSGRVRLQGNGNGESGSTDPGPGREPDAVMVSGLLARLASVPDHRQAAWVDHPLAGVLALCAAAVVAGMRSFTAIASWVSDVPAELLACAYAGAGGRVPARGPSKSTIWRVLTGLDGEALDAAIGDWLMDQAYPSAAEPEPAEAGQASAAGAPGASGRLDGVAIAADGKTCRGAKDPDGRQVHLLSAMTHEKGLVLAQTDVAAKTNEVPRLKDLLSGLATRVNLRGAILTVDALHTVRETARWLHKEGIEFVMTAKENIPTLFAALDALPWHDVPIGYESLDRGHGRITRRTIQTLPAPKDLPFPHVSQVFLVERSVTDLHGVNLSSVAALGVTSQTPGRASPARLAAQVQGHWAIESLHWIRDHVYREDHSNVRNGSGPRTMASLRNLAVGAHRLIGRTDIAEATRWAGRQMTRPFQILNLDQES